MSTTLTRPVHDPKPLADQVVVITGASSGIGLTTARMAADRGARVVAAARSTDALEELADEVDREGGELTPVTADVSDPTDIKQIADTAEDRYGRIDTWVNGAAVSIYGQLVDVPLEEMQSQFEINVWGVVAGSIAAVEHMRESGGTIINVGSITSDRAFPLQGSYAASKHAVKGVTDTLRMELDLEAVPIEVVLIKPAAIDTPLPEHAANYMDEAARIPPPVYAPETVARAICTAAERPQREVIVGGGGKLFVLLERLTPGLLDRIMERVLPAKQKRAGQPRTESGLDGPSGDLEQRGRYDGPVRERSFYTRLTQAGRGPDALHTLALAAAAGYAGYRLLRRR